jgi:protein-S-isoprenylcysteine O-methyltransferase Ste14
MSDRARLRAAVGSLVFLVLVPGVVAGVVPWALTGWHAGEGAPFWLPVRLVGAALVAGGAAVLLHAFGRFVLEGVGTPAPVAPTQHLVVGGLYRYVRNPMYVAVAGVIVGQALLLARPLLLVYGAAFVAVVSAFVRWYEEPTLRAQFGAEYDAYRRAVPAWWPRRTGWCGRRRVTGPGGRSLRSGSGPVRRETVRAER